MYTKPSYAKRILQQGFIKSDNLHTVKQVDCDFNDGTQLEWLKASDPWMQSI